MIYDTNHESPTLSSICLLDTNWSFSVTQHLCCLDSLVSLNDKGNEQNDYKHEQTSSSQSNNDITLTRYFRWELQNFRIRLRNHNCLYNKLAKKIPLLLLGVKFVAFRSFSLGLLANELRLKWENGINQQINKNCSSSIKSSITGMQMLFHRFARSDHSQFTVNKRFSLHLTANLNA